MKSVAKDLSRDWELEARLGKIKFGVIHVFLTIL